MAIENTPTIRNDQRVNDMRGAIEHRATWMYLLLDEMKKAGVDWETAGRKAILRCGAFHGKTKFTQTDDVKVLGKEFANELFSKIFEMDVKELPSDKFVVEFHYCPLVAAWKKQSPRNRAHTCGILCRVLQSYCATAPTILANRVAKEQDARDHTFHNEQCPVLLPESPR